MKAIILSVLLAISCTRDATLTKDSVGLRLTDVEMPISHLNEIEWTVGKRKEGTLTQSIVFIVDMPRVADDDLKHLTDSKGIDSWILRLMVQRGSQVQDLGSLYARFRPQNVVRGQSAGAPSNVTLKIYYAAAYASERFRHSKCPPFEHSLRVSEMDIKGENSSFELTFDKVNSYGEKSHLVELTPSAFNAGHSMIGQYFVEIAPYDSVKKNIHAPFKRLPMYIEVTSEKKEVIKSCLGEHPEISQ